jgi:hypothetical protein
MLQCDMAVVENVGTQHRILPKWCFEATSTSILLVRGKHFWCNLKFSKMSVT